MALCPLGPCTTIDGVPVKPNDCAWLLPSWMTASHFEALRSVFHLLMSGTPAPLATLVRKSSVTYPEFSLP
jgi:hypothetical protein